MSGDDDWGKAAKDSFDIVYNSGLCVIGDSLSCLKAISKTTKNIVNFIEEGFKTYEEFAYYAEMKRQFDEHEKVLLCATENTCVAAGGYWWSIGTCRYTKETLECNHSHLNLCTTSNTCTNAGGYWWSSNTCKSTPDLMP